MVDAGRRWTAWQASWHPNHGDEDPTAGVLPRGSAGQLPWGSATPDTTQQKGHCTGLATAATSQLQGDTPMSSWRLGALLSCVGLGGYEGRAMGQRKGEGVQGWSGEAVLMGVAEAVLR